MNSPAAQGLIRSVENVLWNYQQNGNVSAEEAIAGVARAYEREYGPVPFGTNKDK